MKLLTYLLLVGGIAATPIEVVDQASNATQPAATTSTNTNTTTPQSTNSLATLSSAIPYDEAADKRIEKFGMAIEVMTEVANVVSGLADAFDNTGLKKIMAIAGGPLAIMSIVMIFLPKQPSPEERAIAAALATITKKMD